MHVKKKRHYAEVILLFAVNFETHFSVLQKLGVENEVTNYYITDMNEIDRSKQLKHSL